MGAPRKYAPHGAAEIIKDLALQGHSLTGIASHFKVARTTVLRWFEDDCALEEAFEQGREFERKALDDLIKRDAAAGKPANANAMFLLKCRHRYREVDSPKNDQPNNLSVQVTNVLLVKDHGSDADWQAKAAEQQRKLTAPSVEAKLVIAPSDEVMPPILSAPAWAPKVLR